MLAVMRFEVVNQRRSIMHLQYKAYSLWFAARERFRREEGQALVEYALILALVSIVSILVLQALGLDIKGVFQRVETAVSNTPTP
jgi:pilus assembly protein Flp/PilA